MSRIWFITGASRGIGAEIAKAALAAGDKVVATGRDRDRVAQAFAEAGDRVLPLALDVTQEQQVHAAIDAALARFGRIDVLVNNVGGSAAGGPVEMSEEVWDAQVDANLKSVVLVCKHVLPVMERQGAGAIVNIASSSGLRWTGDVEALLKSRLARIPLGFAGDGRDTAAAVLFLASDEARFVTGTEIVVDGGMTVRCD
jgi:NAD(P)-dependent dehydrogenase (short-subunit alcohol dehydrogenase family)